MSDATERKRLGRVAHDALAAWVTACARRPGRWQAWFDRSPVGWQTWEEMSSDGRQHYYAMAEAVADVVRAEVHEMYGPLLDALTLWRTLDEREDLAAHVVDAYDGVWSVLAREMAP